MKKKKILWIGDAVVPTGFSRVNTNILRNLPKTKYEIHHLGINYYGDPHGYTWKIYPAVTGGDVYGFGRLEQLAYLKPDIIFILNDPWLISKYLDIVKKKYDPIPKIVVYYPVDSLELDQFHFNNWEIVTVPVVYTEFGYVQTKIAKPEFNIKIIPHGVDQTIFKRLAKDRTEIRKIIFNNDPVISDNDAFIVLNANRNQPRKRIDITLEGFANFAIKKPENVKIYLHMGMRDAGWDIVRLALRYGIEKRIILTSLEPKNLTVPENSLNQIYNGCDVGLNTSSGEGWGLVSMEHSITGAAQIVPDHSACTELFKDCGLLVPANYHFIEPSTMTKHSLVSSEDVTIALETLYTDTELKQKLAKAAMEKFSKPEYSWPVIAKQWDEIFESI